MKKKQALSLILALVMVLALLPGAAGAAEPEVIWLDETYRHVWPFSDGLARVEKAYNTSSTFGFIDATGKAVIPFIYEYAYDFCEGRARVKKDGKYGFVDVNGNEITPCVYDFVHDFCEGRAWVEKGGKFGFVDLNGSEVAPCVYEYAEDFSDGLAHVIVGDRGTGGHGYIDKTGKLAIDLGREYGACMSFSEGYAAVFPFESNAGGYIDKTGKLVLPCKFFAPGPFSNGRAAVNDHSYAPMFVFGYIDTSGKLVIPCQYNNDKLFSDGIVAVGKWVEVDGAPDYDRYTYGFIDTNGNTVVPLVYDEVRDFSEGLAAVETLEYKDDSWQADVKWGFVDKTGKEVIPRVYQDASDFSEGLAAVKKDDKWGCIDKAGNVVVPFLYSHISDFSGGCAVVRESRNGRLGILKSPLTAAPTAPTSTDVDPQPAGVANQSTQPVEIGGKRVELQAYALKNAGGSPTNYVKVRDVAMLLNGTASQFDVQWDGAVNLVTNTPYGKPNGQENHTPYSGDRPYTKFTGVTKLNGVAVDLQAFVILDDNGNGSTYYKLRDLGRVLGFNVGWTRDRGIYIEPGKPYDPTN